MDELLLLAYICVYLGRLCMYNNKRIYMKGPKRTCGSQYQHTTAFLLNCPVPGIETKPSQHILLNTYTAMLPNMPPWQEYISHCC